MPHTRIWIGRLFWSGAVLSFVSLLALLITLTLQSVGDTTGAAAVWGVFLVSASAWIIDVVAVIALLAWRTMQESDEPPGGTPRP
jgi:hypothetical protein